MLDDAELNNTETKRYYNISEVAEILNVSASLIRFWEKKFTQINPIKNKKGNRLFTLKDIEQLKLIYILVKQQGYTLDGAASYLNEKSSSNNVDELIIQLNSLKNFLIKLRNNL